MAMPNCGYGSNKKTKHVMPNGFLKFVVNNVKVSGAARGLRKGGQGLCRKLHSRGDLVAVEGYSWCMIQA